MKNAFFLNFQYKDDCLVIIGSQYKGLRATKSLRFLPKV